VVVGFAAIVAALLLTLLHRRRRTRTQPATCHLEPEAV
jgi:hypothetical protein